VSERSKVEKKEKQEKEKEPNFDSFVLKTEI